MPFSKTYIKLHPTKINLGPEEDTNQAQDSPKIMQADVEEKLGTTNRDLSVFKTNYMLTSFDFPFLSRQKKNLQGKWLGSRHH